MTGAFTKRWSDEQREACASAKLDRGATAKRVKEMARAGELTTPEGDTLAPFDPPMSTIAGWVQDARRRRLGEKASGLAQLPPRDAVEALRRRLINMVDAEIAHDEKRKAGARDPERIRQFGRALRELQAIPGANEQAKPAPGAKVDGKRDGGETKGGLAGDILKAHRNGQGSTAPETQTETKPTTENGDAAERSVQDDEDEGTKDGERPGSLARAIAARHLSTA